MPTMSTTPANTTTLAAPLGRIALLSLGCAKNLVDSEQLVGALRQAGFTMAESLDTADLALINTCGFIDAAKQESIDTILRVATQKEFGRLRGIMVSGCLVERYLDDLRNDIPEVDRWIPFGDYGRITNHARELMSLKQVRDLPAERVLLTPTAYAYLKVSEGCDQRCAFCAIPSFRGKLKSRTIEENVADARKLAARGVGEINIVSQDTTAYGRDIYGKPALAKLLRELTTIDGPSWWRVLYLYPSTLRDDVLEEMASNDRIAKYIDIPLQHMSNNVLRAMRRGITGERQRKLLQRIRDVIPNVAIRTTLISGFPGETEDDHRELVEFVREGWFDRMGVFPFSREESTPSYAMDAQVPGEVIEARRQELMEAQQRVHLERNASLVGSTMDVLIEEHSPITKRASGRTQHDAPEVDGKVHISGLAMARPGAIVRCTVTGADDYDLTATPCA